LAQRLNSCGYDVLGLDADPHSVGFIHAQLTRLVPRSDDVNFVEELRAVCVDEHPAALVVTVEEELLHLASVGGALEGTGVRAWIPNADYVSHCIDKFAFHQLLAHHGLPVPRTVLGENARRSTLEKGIEYIVKPRYGRGARNTFRCRSVDEVQAITGAIPGMVVQTKVDGREFTADCLVDRSGGMSAVIRIRHRTKAGVSVVGETVHHPEARAVITEVLRVTGASAICNVQGFILGDGSEVAITEVNPRFSGGFPLSEYAGAQLVKEYLNGLFEDQINHKNLDYRTGMIMFRYFTESFGVAPDSIQEHVSQYKVNA
jgi:carbamoyl-phosphate synthase large subunit